MAEQLKPHRHEALGHPDHSFHVSLASGVGHGEQAGPEPLLDGRQLSHLTGAVRLLCGEERAELVWHAMEHRLQWREPWRHGAPVFDRCPHGLLGPAEGWGCRAGGKELDYTVDEGGRHGGVGVPLPVDPHRGEHLGPLAVAGGTAVIVGHYVYYSTFAERTFARDLRTGALAWTYPLGRYVPLSADKDHLYLSVHTRIQAFIPRPAK